MQQAGAPDPKPLRSEAHPAGLPGLHGLALQKVQAANAVYAGCMRIIEWAREKGVTFSLENPHRSLFWWLPQVARLREARNVSDIIFDHCMFGASRQKRQCWRTDQVAFGALARTCDGSHKHQSWAARRGKDGWTFPTADECAYPHELCTEVARLLGQAFGPLPRGQPVSAPLPARPPKRPADSAAALERKRLRVAAGRQPGPSLLPPVIPELHALVAVAVCPHVQEPAPMSRVARLWPTPRHVRDLGTLAFGGGHSGCQDTEDTQPSGGLQEAVKQAVQRLGRPPPSHMELRALDARCAGCTAARAPDQVELFGVDHEPLEFVHAARQLKHPFDEGAWVPDTLLRAAFRLLTLGPSEISRRRSKTLEEFDRRARELQPMEDKEKAALPPARRRLVEGKRFLLLQELADRAGLPDKRLAADGFGGTPVVGVPERSGMFRPVEEAPQVDQGELRKHARWCRRAMEARARPCGDEELDRDLWNATLAEVAEGHLEGPMTEQDMQERFGEGWLACPRFAIRQGGKTRAIDDGTAPMTNLAYAPSERIALGGVDEVVALARAVIGAVGEDRRVRIRLAGGCWLEGELHPELTVATAKSLVGRTLDLKAAYRQLLSAEGTGWANNVVVWNPDKGRPEYFVAHSLLFGTTASVVAFCRYSRAIWAIGATLLDLLWGNYIDDFPGLDLQVAAGDAERASKGLLGVLGWSWAQAPDKDKPAAPAFGMLGVVTDLTLAAEDCIVVRNTEKRRDELVAEIREIRKDGKLQPSRAAALLGRAQFAETQLFGRWGALVLAPVRDIAHGRRQGSPIDRDVAAALGHLAGLLMVAAPRRLRCRGAKPPLLLFTDGSCEPDGHGSGLVGRIGAILQDPHTGLEVFMSEAVPAELMASWEAGGSKQLIAQVETLAVVASLVAFARVARERRVFAFIDNDGCRASLINMKSSSSQIRSLLLSLAFVLAKHPCFLWFARVASHANPADAPSRCEAEELGTFPGARRLRLPPACLEALAAPQWARFWEGGCDSGATLGGGLGKVARQRPWARPPFRGRTGPTRSADLKGAPAHGELHPPAGGATPSLPH